MHIVAFPDGEEIPESLTAYCGELILRGTAEALTKPCGMPCTLCLWRAPLPPPPSELPAGA
ncbi:hypothetical protein GTS_13300 [Gandjariella thermophila]|uniref:Uncharacterized protein n=1 Tax=Gandjariella thermophila TaxID=1931992 RepID=A0A4D4J6W2_9PSEU|nr:hypothetical protein GTS_13300 [Gandjariella thermophila]